MAEPLTFKFVFADESEASAPPPDASPGAAARTTRPLAPDETPPQPRAAPSPKASPAAPSTSPAAPRDDDAEVQVSPAPRTAPQPRRQPQSPEASTPDRRQPRAPQASSSVEARSPQAGGADRLARDLMAHLSSLPGLGKSIGTLGRIIDPLLQARLQIAAVRAKATGEATPKGPRQALPPLDVSPAPAPRPPEPEKAAPTAAARPPDEKPDERAPGDILRNPTPGTTAAALEKLITALGPLPEEQKELAATLKPLTALGYTLKELVAAVRSMRDAEKAAKLGGASSPAPRPVSSPAPSSGGGSPAPAPRPPKPGPATITPRDVRPTPGDATPIPAPGAAAGAADAGLADAAAGGAVAAGAAGGPVGIIAGIAIVATIGAASRALGALVNTVKKVDRSFVELSGRLAPFNGRLAFAQARAQTQQTLLDIERAGRLGGDLAKFTDERSRISREFQRVATEFQSVILPAVNAAAGKIADTVEESRRSFGMGLDFIGNLMGSMSVSQAATATAAKALKKAADEMEAERKAKEAMDVAGIFFGDGSKQLSIGGVDYGSAADWADYIPQAPVRPNRNGPTFGGI